MEAVAWRLIETAPKEEPIIAAHIAEKAALLIGELWRAPDGSFFKQDCTTPYVGPVSHWQSMPKLGTSVAPADAPGSTDRDEMIEDAEDAADDLIDSVQYLQAALEAGEGVYESKWLGGVMRAHEMLLKLSDHVKHTDAWPCDGEGDESGNFVCKNTTNSAAKRGDTPVAFRWKWRDPAFPSQGPFGPGWFLWEKQPDDDTLKVIEPLYASPLLPDGYVPEALKIARGAILDIQRATIEGRVCDDVAWFSTIETLHDFCASAIENIDNHIARSALKDT